MTPMQRQPASSDRGGRAGTTKCSGALVSTSPAAAICYVRWHHCAAPSGGRSLPNSTWMAPRPYRELEVSLSQILPALCLTK